MVTKILVIFGPAYHKIILKLLRNFQALWMSCGCHRQTDRQTHTHTHFRLLYRYHFKPPNYRRLSRCVLTSSLSAILLLLNVENEKVQQRGDLRWRNTSNMFLYHQPVRSILQMNTQTHTHTQHVISNAYLFLFGTESRLIKWGGARGALDS